MTKTLAFSDNAPIIAQYEPPTNLSPGEVGMLHDGVFERREVTATLIDLSIRGYIALHEVSSGYEIELLRQDASMLKLKTHEKLLLDGLFGVIGALEMERTQASVTNEQARANIARYYADRDGRPSMVGVVVSGNELRRKITTVAEKAEAALRRELFDAGYYATPIGVPSAIAAIGVFIALGVVPFIKDSRTGLLIVVSTTAVLFVIAIGLFLYRRSRTDVTRLGHRAKKYIEGFQLYLDIAEKDRYRGTQAPIAAEKDETRVVLYEKYLAYAIALGLERQWASKFSSLEQKTPFVIQVVGGLVLGLGALLLTTPTRR